MRISGGDSYWAEGIVQRTFVRLWEIHDQVSPDKSLISYLCTIAKNLLMNVYQRQTVEYIYAEYVLESSKNIAIMPMESWTVSCWKNISIDLPRNCRRRVRKYLF